MKRKVVCVILLACLFLHVVTSLASAATLNLPAIDRGWYNIGAKHTPSNTNYVVGGSQGNNPNDPAYVEIRNFFVFDLASVTSPVVSAKLALSLPSDGYVSGDPSETYELHDVATSLVPLLNGTGGIAAFTDLGDGAVYGSRTFTRADVGTIVEIPLSAAAITAMNNSHSRFAIGGKLTTIDGSPTDEKIFAWTNYGSSHITELRLTLIPEPTCIALFSMAAMMLGNSGRRHR